MVVPGAGCGCACGVPPGTMPGTPEGGATVDGAANGGCPVTGAGGNTAFGTTVLFVGGAAHGALGAGMMLEIEGIKPPLEKHGSGGQALTGVEQTGLGQAGGGQTGAAYMGGGPWLYATMNSPGASGTGDPLVGCGVLLCPVSFASSPSRFLSWLHRPKSPFLGGGSGTGAEQVVVPQGLLTGDGAWAEELPPMLMHPVRVRLEAATTAA